MFEADTFTNRLLIALLSRTDALHYVSELFGPILKRLYNFTAQTRGSHPMAPGPVPPEIAPSEMQSMLPGEAKPFDGHTLDQLFVICDEALDAIVGHLPCMPRHIRWLLKVIEVQAMKHVPPLRDPSLAPEAWLRCPRRNPTHPLRPPLPKVVVPDHRRSHSARLGEGLRSAPRIREQPNCVSEAAERGVALAADGGEDGICDPSQPVHREQGVKRDFAIR